MPYANNNGPDQPAHLHSLIRTFVVHCLGSMICILAISKVSRFYLAPVTEQAGVNLTWLKITENRFSCDVAHTIQIQATLFISKSRGPYKIIRVISSLR